MTEDRDRTRKRWILAAMGVGGGLIVLDETVIGIALPSLRHDLGMSQVTAHWVVSAYLLTFASFAAAGGKLGDLFGLRNVFIASLALFAISSLAAGMARDAAWLIAARGAQGIGAAMIFPLSIAMVGTSFAKNERGGAIGVVAATGTAFLAAGPLVGGLITQHLSWRWVFLINAPIAVIVALLVVRAWVEPAPRAQRARLDLGGLATLVASLALLVFATMESARMGWTDPLILGCFAAGLGCLAAFAVYEGRMREPLIEVGLFRDASFSASVLVIFSVQLAKIVVVIFGAIYLQERLGMTPLTAGWALLAAVVATPFSAAPSGRAADRFGARRPALLGLTAVAVSVLWIALVVPLDRYLLLAPALIIWGAAGPLAFLPSQRAIMNTVTSDQQGQANGVAITARLLGGAVGMALGSALLATTGSFQAVFASTAVILVLVLVLAWRAIDKPPSDSRPSRSTT